MAAWTRHVRAAGGLLNGDLAFGTFVSQEEEVNEAHDGFDIECFAVWEGGLAFWAMKIGLPTPFALFHGENVVTALRWAFLDVRSKCTVLFKQKFLEL